MCVYTKTKEGYTGFGKLRQENQHVLHDIFWRNLKSEA